MLLEKLKIFESITFEIRQVFYFYYIPFGAENGCFAYYNLGHYIVAASETFTFLFDGGKRQREIYLNDPSKCICIKPGILGRNYRFFKRF